MAYNKVDADGKTLIDLTSDTVTADTLVSGRTAHLASGERVTGTFEPVTGVKGNAESTYRKGDVNLTPANIGAATSAQGTKADSAVQTIKMNGNAVTKTSGVVDLGTVITAHQNISGKADKSATVSTVTYDTTNKKLTKTINGTTSDIVTTAKLKTDMALSKSDVGLGNVGNFKAVSTVASQGLTDTEKANARTNIGAGTSSFSGNYADLANPPTIPPAVAVKGNAETNYRTGNVNLTPANIGAATTAQGTKADNAIQTVQVNGTAQTKTNNTVNISLDKSSVGLENVDNTSDLNKPISTATQTALNAQQAQIDDNSEVSEVTDTTPYLYKSSEHDAVYDELVGGSVVWNQLVANSGSSLSVTITSGHKYVMKKSGTLSVGASSGSAITGLTGGTDWITDLTQMFGTTIADYVYTLEQSTANSGIAWLKSYGFFTKDYYAYKAGELVSVNTSGRKVVSETTEITYPIQSTDLRGLYKLNGNKLYTDGDIYSADGQITRKYRIVDLGTLNWKYEKIAGGRNGFISYQSGLKYAASGIPALLCNRYIAYHLNLIYVVTSTLIGVTTATNSPNLIVFDSSYTDVATFKTAMSGVYLIYELATPTTETAQPFASPQMVYRNGTEEYLDTRDVQIPVGGNRKYVDIPDWMVNEYFDDVRAETSTLLVKIENINNGINEIESDMRGVTQDLNDISEELDCLLIQAALVNNEVVIQNTSDFTDELYSKYFSYTKPKFAILKLQITSNTHYYKALINSSSVSHGNLMEASFITLATGEYIYHFTWLRTVTVGTPTVIRKALNLGS